MPCKIMQKKHCMGRLVASRLMNWRQNLRVFLEAEWDPPECVWKNSEPTKLPRRSYCMEKVRIHCSTTIWCTSLFLCLKLWKFRQRKQRWMKEWEKIGERFRRGTWRKSESKIKGDRWSKDWKALQFILHRLMDICHLKNAELEAKDQKYKGRVVLRGDIVKDDSGSYAVFTEQGSSASQMTAAKIMDIISRLPGCTGQAARRSYLPIHSSQECNDAPTLMKIPKSECPDIWIRPPRHNWPKS